jgi:quercetin dioxygenase-like cupin family protein
MRSLIRCAVTLALLAGQPALAQEQRDQGPRPPASVKLDFAAVIPNVPGKSLKTVVVDYAPGGSSPAHSHAKSAFILATVLEGSVTSAVNGAPPRIFRAGEWWTENPGDHHAVSANSSKTKPARLLAIFVVDTADTELTTNDPR